MEDKQMFDVITPATPNPLVGFVPRVTPLSAAAERGGHMTSNQENVFSLTIEGNMRSKTLALLSAGLMVVKALALLSITAAEVAAEENAPSYSVLYNFTNA